MMACPDRDQLELLLAKRLAEGARDELEMHVEKEVSKASIAKIVGVSPTNLRHFIRTRKLDPKAPEIPFRARRP
jgi:hypothetical protein